jgi:uncharacterized protein (DUF302 family)
MSDLAIEVTLQESFAEAVEKVQAALKEEGFGVLTRIDIHDAFKEKLGVDFRHYTILGACNPPLAHKALSSRPDVGMMLPCNVTVEEDGQGGSVVRIVDAHAMMSAGGLAGDPVLSEVGEEAAERLGRVAESLRA